MADDASNEAAPSSGKGKGKALDGDVDGGAKASQAEPSLTERVVNSATGLLRNTVGSSNGHVPGLIASSTSLGSKAQFSGSSSGPTGWTETGAVRTASGTIAGQQELAKNESFRTAYNQSSTAEEFGKFLSSPSRSLDPGALLEQSNYPSKAKDNVFEPDHFQRPVSSSRDASQQYTPAPIAFDDGAEVRDLLSNPAFDSAFNDDIDDSSANHPGVIPANVLGFPLDDGAEVRNLLSETTKDSVFDDNLDDLSTAEHSNIGVNSPAYSELEREIVTAMKSDLPPPPTHKDVPKNHPLNLRPLSDAEKESLPQDIQNYLEVRSAAMESLARIPTGEERDDWLADWEDVLSDYSNQVWGDMLPIVKAAKSELEEVRNGAVSLDPKTIARLKMILGHINQNGPLPTPDPMFVHQRANKPKDA